MKRRPRIEWLPGCGAGFALLAVLMAGCSGNARQGDQVEQRVGAAANTAGGPSVERYDLGADEKRGGHTIDKHVGRTDLELIDRLQREPDISAASTWTNLEVAEETVEEALHAERGKIERWEARGKRRPNLALHYHARRIIGRTVVRGASKSDPCDQAVIVLRSDGPGFFVLTTYPEGQ